MMNESSMVNVMPIKGCSTLEMLRRPDTNMPVSNRMQKEMNLVQQLEIEEHAKYLQRVKIPHQCSPLQGVGELDIREKIVFPPQINVQHHKRRLVAGKLRVSSRQDNTRPTRRSPEKEDKDAASFIRTSMSYTPRESRISQYSYRSKNKNKLSTRSSAPSLSIATSQTSNEMRQLRVEQQNLELELLQVTKKLHHKLETQNNKSTYLTSKSGGALKDMARIWSIPNLTPGDKKAIYLHGRYTTQSNIDYHRKKNKLSAEDTLNYRKHQAHTKYGDALYQSKNSLRGRF